MQAQVGSRVSLRYADGSPSELVGWVTAVDPERLVLLDRHQQRHELAWVDVISWRLVGVPRGRDPRRADRTALDELAASHAGRCFVARLSDLLGGRPPMAIQASTPAGIHVDGEWATASATPELIAHCWWASRQDARSVQVRTDDDRQIEWLLELGFSELS